MKTITLTYKHGIDDLKSLFAFRGNSQGDDSGSNDVSLNINNTWMSFGFDCEKTQEAVDREVKIRARWNEDYIEKLKAKGEFGKEYTTSVSFQPHPVFDEIQNKLLQSSSFYILDLSKGAFAPFFPKT